MAFILITVAGLVGSVVVWSATHNLLAAIIVPVIIGVFLVWAINGTLEE